jgi:hypothetical protein
MAIWAMTKRLLIFSKASSTVILAMYFPSSTFCKNTKIEISGNTQRGALLVGVDLYAVD